MSNRLLWILIIIWFIWAGYIYYHLKYIPNKQEKVREEQIIQKEKQEQEIEEKNKPKLIKRNIVEKELTNTQKIEEIKEKNNNYRVFRLENSYKAYFKQSWDGLDLFFNEDIIWSFPLVLADQLRVDIVKWTRKDLYIEVWDKKFVYKDNTKIISTIKLDIDVDYVKSTINNSIIIVSSKGSFIYSIYDKYLEFFTYFSDFIHFDDWYLGLVNKNEKRILNNLWFESNNKDLIVYYNPNTKEKKLVYETELALWKMYINKEKLYIVTDEWELYKLENIK